MTNQELIAEIERVRSVIDKLNLYLESDADHELLADWEEDLAQLLNECNQRVSA